MVVGRRIFALCVAFSVLALSAGTSHALGTPEDPGTPKEVGTPEGVDTLEELETPEELRTPSMPASCASPSSCCTVAATCLALDDEKAIEEYRQVHGGKGIRWIDTIRRSVKFSAWDTSRVWVQIAPLFGSSLGGLLGYSEPVHLVERERDGVKIAFVTISPAQVLLLGWRLRNALDQVSRGSPQLIDSEYYYERYWHWRNTMPFSRNNREHSPENIARFRQETHRHYPYFADLFRPYAKGIQYVMEPRPEREASCCCDISQPLLAHLVSLLLHEKGRIATLAEIMSTDGDDLVSLAPDCANTRSAC